MNRIFTNLIRFVMDECLPPIIRDSSWFMYPFYNFAYRGKDIAQVMRFKSRVHSMSESEYRQFYENLETISRDRPSDLNSGSIKMILDGLDPGTQSLLDVGCGHGMLLQRIHERLPNIKLVGCDLKEPKNLSGFSFLIGQPNQLNLESKSFDVVTCCHTLEHIVDIEGFVKELIRIARRQIVVVVPCQRYFYYTLDEHVHFFHYQEKLTSLIGLERFRIKRIWGDWVYIGYLDSSA